VLEYTPHVDERQMSRPSSTVSSPCVRNCCLDDDLICLGCSRSVEEIKEWGVVDDERRLEILHNARRRKAALAVPS
jgi:hypothetical protein